MKMLAYKTRVIWEMSLFFFFFKQEKLFSQPKNQLDWSLNKDQTTTETSRSDNKDSFFW